MADRLVVARTTAASPMSVAASGQQEVTLLMPKVRYRDSNGTETVVDAVVGDSVMETAVRHGIKGIVAECGGAMVCATCHVYVSAEIFDQLPPIDEQEDDMLDGTASDRRPTSRLSCQIVVSEELPQIEVDIPPEQL